MYRLCKSENRSHCQLRWNFQHRVAGRKETGPGSKTFELLTNTFAREWQLSNTSKAPLSAPVAALILTDVAVPVQPASYTALKDRGRAFSLCSGTDHSLLCALSKTGRMPLATCVCTQEACEAGQIR